MEIRQHSILRISDEKTLELVNLYEKEECLWNTSLGVYRHRKTRLQAAGRIAKTLNLPNFTSRHVLIKFKNLRNSYCQELKKVANSVKTGQDPVYKPKVFWFNKMDSFVRPHLQQHGKKRKLPCKILSVKPEPTEDDEIDPSSNSKDVKKEPSNYYSDNMEIEEGDPPEIRSRNSSTISKSLKLEESQESNLVQLMKDITHNLQVITSQNQDCYDSFGKYVSAMLRSMPLERAMEVQPQIVNLLVKATYKGEGNETHETIT